LTDIGHQVDFSDIAPRRGSRHYESYPVSSQESKHWGGDLSESKSYARRILLKLKDKLPTLRRGNAKQDPEEYSRGRHSIGTWDVSEPSFQDRPIPGQGKSFTSGKKPQAKRFIDEEQQQLRLQERKHRRNLKYYK
jgi:hypothetical protein